MSAACPSCGASTGVTAKDWYTRRFYHVLQRIEDGDETAAPLLSRIELEVNHQFGPQVGAEMRAAASARLN